MVTLHIEVETVIYDAGTADEETLKEVECTLINTGTNPVIYDYSLNPTDYPDNASVQTFITDDLTLKGITWDTVETIEVI